MQRDVLGAVPAFPHPWAQIHDSGRGADAPLGACFWLVSCMHEAKCPVEYGSQEIRYLTVQHAGDVHAAARESACAKRTLGIYF
jgi:hypothetical protein